MSSLPIPAVSRVSLVKARHLLASAVLLLAFVYPAPAFAAERNVKVLALIPTGHEALQVAFVTDGEFMRAALVGGALMAMINSSIAEHRNNPLALQLNETMAGYERAPHFAQAIRDSFRRRSGAFDVTTSTERARYVTGRDKLTGAAAAEGVDFVLVMDSEFVGLWMAGAYTKTDDLTPAQTIRYRLIRVRKPDVIAKGFVTGFGHQRKYYQQAVGDREFFTSLWPQVCIALADRITGDLNREDQLHHMAASIGRGAEVPAIGTLLEKYEKTFRFDLAPAAGWKETRLDTPYARVLEPKDDSRLVMGLRFDLDLLVPEFGQDVRTVEEYVLSYGQRRLEALPKSTPLRPWDGIDAPGFTTYIAETGDGGHNVILFRVLGERQVQVVNAVFLKDFELHYPANRAKIERMIAQSRIVPRRSSLTPR